MHTVCVSLLFSTEVVVFFISNLGLGSLMVLCRILAVWTELFWTEIFKVAPEMCWSHSQFVGPSPAMRP